jgi:tetratricopeptide (TPR) repeat protein
MSDFICNTPTCAISLSKAAFPVQMMCPVCQQALSEVIEKSLLSADYELLISKLPYVIAYPLKRTLLEQHAWTKINLLKDTFLNFLKYLGLITASEFFNSDLKDKKMVALFYASLAEPSFGTWNLYIRETIAYLNQNDHRFFCPELPGYYEAIETDKKRKLYKGEIEFMDSNGDVQLKKQEATAIGMLINFRNRYLGHGLTLDEYASKELWDEYYPIFYKLLSQLNFPMVYPMFKHEHGETYLLQSSELSIVEKGDQISASVWMQNPSGQTMDILPFFIVPGELALTKDDKEQLLTYESYTGKTIKFFSPEGTEKQTSGKILEKLNLLLRDKQKETPFSPEAFTKDEFLKRIAEENKLTLDTLVAEKKYIPGVYVHREEMEIKLREWIGARANIFFIAAEAGSGKTNLLLEMQQQYAAQNLSVLFIRAARMDKLSLQAQIAHLLNIQPELGLEHYASIAGTQTNPTFILIDGLNEAAQAESLWQEIIEISKKYTRGSLKFVVSSRANTSADLNFYILSESDEEYLYGEKKEGHKSLSDFAFWLTALNMAEMKSAWETYGQTNKNKYKPQFSFDDIATFDRGIYNLISNPLVLRIFLETYHHKSLPNKGSKHLNIWQDWLSTFSEVEIIFLKNLAQAVWDKGENELFLDDLLNNQKLRPFLTSDLINAPYPRLKNLGWISRYVKDFNTCLSFTVEGSLLYLMGVQLGEQSVGHDFELVKSLLIKGTKIQQSAVESYLCQLALSGDLALVCELIDAGEDYHYACNAAMLIFIRSYGVNTFVKKVFSEPTDNDWLAILMLNKTLGDLQELVLRKRLLEELMPLNTFSTKVSFELGLIACSVMDREQAQSYLLEMDECSDLFSEDEKIQKYYGDVYRKFGKYDKALDSYQKCLDIELNTLGTEHRDVATSFNKLGSVWSDKGEFEKALDCYQKCLDIRLITLGVEHPKVGTSYNNLGLVWKRKGEHKKALDLYLKCLDIQLKTLGAEHPDVAASYNNLGAVWRSKGKYDKALDLYQKCQDILLKTMGAEHPKVAVSYGNMGLLWKDKGKYDKSLDLYQKCLDIRLKALGAEHPDVAISYNNIGVLWESKGEYDKALDFYQKCLNIRLKTLGAAHPKVAISYKKIGVLWESKGEYDKALDFYQKCLNIRLKTLGAAHPGVANLYNHIGVLWKKKGEYDKALDFYQKCLNIRLKTLGAAHPGVANLYNHIGVLWKKKGEYDKSLDLYQKCLDIQLKTLGAEHPDVANLYNHIGVLWKKKGEYDKALKYYQKCLEIRIITLGELHQNVGFLHFEIGVYQKRSQMYLDAINSFKAGFTILAKGGIAFQIGQCYEALKEYNTAINYYLQSAEIRRDNPDLGLEASSTKEAIAAAKSLAVYLGIEKDLPIWIKELKL